MSFLYLGALLVSLAGMVVLDRRFGLFFWRGPVRAAIVLAVGLVFFLAWDLQGIRLGIFFRGETSFMTGWQWAPQLPLEEPFFLLLLGYLTMNAYGFFVGRRGARTPGGRVARATRAPGGRVAREARVSRPDPQ